MTTMNSNIRTSIWKEIDLQIDSTVCNFCNKTSWQLWTEVYSRVRQVVDVKVDLQISRPIRLQCQLQR